MSINDRMRKVDLNKMDNDALANLEVQLGEKTAKLLNKTAEEINKFLNIYGLQAKLSYQLEELEKVEEKDVESVDDRKV